MKTHFALLRLAVMLAAGFLFVLTARGESALVGNKAFAGQTLDADAVKAALLGKKVTLGSTRLVIVIAKSGEAQEHFLQQHLGMNTSQFQNHWRRLFMTGGGTAPKIVENDAEAGKLVAETPGALAIVDKVRAEGLAILASEK